MIKKHENIPGTFSFDLDGKQHEIKASFKAIYLIESEYLQRPLVEILQDLSDGKSKIADIVSIIHAGLIANNDTRYSYEELGELVYQNGAMKLWPVCIEYVTHILTAGMTESKKK